MTLTEPTSEPIVRRVEHGDVVGYRYLVREASKRLLGVCAEVTHYLHGGVGTQPSSIETQMEGRTIGETFSASVAPQSDFGHLGWRRLLTLPRTRFPHKMQHQLEPGMSVETSSSGGEPRTVWIVSANDRDVIVEFDPPGRKLRFDIAVVSIRRATQAEQQCGRPAGVPHARSRHGGKS